MENSPIQNLEDAACEALQSLNDSCRDCREKCEEQIRQAPLASVGLALGVGFLFRWIPMTALIGGLIRLALFSIKPLLFLFGLAKLIQLLKSPSPAPIAPGRRDKAAPKSPGQG